MQKLSRGNFVVGCDAISDGCGFTARGDTAEEATQRLMAHAKNDHGMALTPEVISRARHAVQDESS